MPFTDYRDLLDQIIYEIKNEQSGPLRRAVIKAIGVLGALDPYEYKTIQIKEMQADRVPRLIHIWKRYSFPFSNYK